ncbi:hypothetical protein Bcep18194_B0364 [Burkholderia lata]|uniref:Uncharacterized protein n=1 Tax=Burkholderia lata (strain ATCC 17760 / DSM 23089 / LMG 22485 / NCIMB 9086 / R18194 / 383) TaxID=482957 RepID=Q39AN1_BURL3|nr:hypothetical protein Bcep18194_B0364 [Burkholderia lata]
MDAMLASGIDYTRFFYDPNIHLHCEASTMTVCARRPEHGKKKGRPGSPFFFVRDAGRRSRLTGTRYAVRAACGNVSTVLRGAPASSMLTRREISHTHSDDTIAALVYWSASGHHCGAVFCAMMVATSGVRPPASAPHTWYAIEIAV